MLNRNTITIRNEKLKKSMRKRACAECGLKINKGEVYVNKEVRYDKTIISLFSHQLCNQPKFHEAT